MSIAINLCSVSLYKQRPACQISYNYAVWKIISDQSGAPNALPVVIGALAWLFSGLWPSGFQNYRMKVGLGLLVEKRVKVTNIKIIYWSLIYSKEGGLLRWNHKSSVNIQLWALNWCWQGATATRLEILPNPLHFPSDCSRDRVWNVLNESDQNHVNTPTEYYQQYPSHWDNSEIININIDVLPYLASWCLENLYLLEVACDGVMMR